MRDVATVKAALVQRLQGLGLRAVRWADDGRPCDRDDQQLGMGL